MIDPNHKPGIPDPSHAKRVLKFADSVAPAVSVHVLKALWDRIVFDLGVNNKDRWGRLSNAYIREIAREEGRGDNVNLVEERSSLNKIFVTQPKMTWRSLCRAMQFLRVRRFRLALTLEHASGQMTEHGIWVISRPNLTTDPDLDDEISVPVETEFTDTVGQARAAPHRLHVPPPNLREFSGRYPTKSPPSGSTDPDHSA